MTKEERIDWLCRLRSFLVTVDMPKDWRTNFDQALSEEIEPERKKGHWIKVSPANIYECSECGKNVMTDDISAYVFCHGCGAEMRGENNG